MAIVKVAGDLFRNRYSAAAFGHGCNCEGSMGAGIAKGFKERYPRMFEEYRRRCKLQPREFNLGDVFLWKEDGKPYVFNLGTQDHYWHARASYEAIRDSLLGMRQLADVEVIPSIAVPRIGVGYGGLSWKKVSMIIEQSFDKWPGILYVYEGYIAEDALT